MRCPKCGYNSFDHLQNCKKCGKDLVEHRSRFGIKSILLSAAIEETEEVAQIEDTAETVTAPEPEKTMPEALVDAPASESESSDFGFDVMGDNEEENLAFDELFEETPLEDDVDESLPSPETYAKEEPAETPLDDGLKGLSPFDLEESGLLKSNHSNTTEEPDESTLGQEQPESPEKFQDNSSATALGMDETDFANFDEDGTMSFEKDSSHPFGNEEDFQDKGMSESTPVDFSEGDTENLTSVPLNDQPLEQTPGDQFVADTDFQEELLPGNGELPPLPDTTFEEQPLESLEASFGGSSLGTPGASDDFTLGALPVTNLSGLHESTEPDLSEEQTANIPEEESPEASEPIEDIEESLEEVESEEEPNHTPPPFARRITAFSCDIILLGLVGLCFIIVAETALSEKSDGFFPSINTLIDLSIPYFLVVFCLTFGYFTLFHFLAGQTPGKMLTGMRVETTSSEAISFSQAFMRSAGGLIQALPAGLGYLTVLNKEGRGWNDRLAGTRLVDLKNLVEKKSVEELGEPLDMEDPTEQEES